MKEKSDFFYYASKKENFRSRAAFKLIELNKKFKFLNTTKGVLDLCCAPGSWLEVVRKLSPKDTLIVGIDIKELKPLKNCIVIKGDITSPGCKNILKKVLFSFNRKIDLVLNDGAPKMGTNWFRDSYNQNELTLKGLNLASEFLVKNGCFVTKIFRSRFFDKFFFVLQKFFEKINIFKPLSSRKSSAEIFLVCRNFRTVFHSSKIFQNNKKPIKTKNSSIQKKFLGWKQTTNSILNFLRNNRFYRDIFFSNFFLNDELETLLGICFFF
mmetsp:Transcript_14038/g.27905  ORF Transcript_14038/g.27905 Transcript_14038/m.27905 type:complete len:268 (-) Transcript_14038:16-819(-)